MELVKPIRYKEGIFLTRFQVALLSEPATMGRVKVEVDMAKL